MLSSARILLILMTLAAACHDGIGVPNGEHQPDMAKPAPAPKK